VDGAAAGVLFGAVEGRVVVVDGDRAVVAMVVGLPAIRRRGLTLAVTSLAFALMTSEYLLNQTFFGPGTTLDWLPSSRIARPALFGVIDIDTDTRFYYLCLVGLALAIALAYGVRRSRTGRAIIAVRENERAAEAFGISARRLTLFALAFSGFLAAFAGALFVYQQSGLDTSPYQPSASLEVFAMAVIGGLGSIPGALIGATYVRGVDYFLPSEWQILATGVGLLAVLLVLPGGLGAALADGRDVLLRRLARRRSIEVGSFADDAPAASAAASTAPPVGPPRRDGAALVATGVDVRYDGVQVLFGAHLDVAPGEVDIVLPFREDLTQQDGFLHAGIIATVADSAPSCTAASAAVATCGVPTVRRGPGHKCRRIRSGCAGAHQEMNV